MKTKHTLVFALVAAMSAGQAMAYEAGQWLVRGGAITVDPKSSSDGLRSDGALLGDTVKVDDDTQLGVAIAYMINSHFAVELLLATPFKHNIYGKGANFDDLGIDRVGSTKHLPPTLSLQYYPLDAKSAVQPYVGLGVNYTKFFSEDVSSAVESSFSGAKLELDESTGLAVQLGVDFAIDENWFANVAVWRMDIDTEAKIKHDGGVLSVDDVKIDPWVYNIGIGYAF